MDTPIVPPLRTCTKCREQKPATLEFFNRCKTGTLSLTSSCKICAAAITRANYAANREARVQRRRDYVEANRESVLEANRANYQANREQRLEAKKHYVAENPEKLREHWRRMHKMRDSAPGSHTKEQELTLHDDQEGRCGYCGITLHDDWVPDHRHPIALGGSHDIENIVIACPVCNNAKSKLTLDVWMSRRGW